MSEDQKQGSQQAEDDLMDIDLTGCVNLGGITVIAYQPRESKLFTIHLDGEQREEDTVFALFQKMPMIDEVVWVCSLYFSIGDGMMFIATMRTKETPTAEIAFKMLKGNIHKLQAAITQAFARKALAKMAAEEKSAAQKSAEEKPAES